jgi:hypothetical protein
MKKYYLHNGTESSGPFDIEELKAKRITKTSPVWFEGMENWKYAGDISELNMLFVISPPPISSFSVPEPSPIAKQKKVVRKILGMSKNSFFVVCVVLVLATSTFIFNNIRENKNRELRVKNHKTEVENHQIEQQQKELEQQKLLEEEAKKAAAERDIEIKKQAESDRIIEIEKLIAISQNNLEVKIKELKNTNGFKVFRTPGQKKVELSILQKSMDSINTEIDQLKIESNRLKLDLEKLSNKL